MEKPSLWPGGNGRCLRWKRLRVRVMVLSVGYISHVLRAYDYSGPFWVLWVHMASRYKNWVKEKKH